MDENRLIKPALRGSKRWWKKQEIACESKKKLTKRDAQSAINNCSARRRKHYHKGIRMYQCEVCNFWHLSKVTEL